MPQNRATTKAKKRDAGRGKPGENRPTAAQRRAQESNAKCAKNAAEAASGAATPPRAAARKAATGGFKVLDKHAPCIAIANCYRNQFELKPVALWHPIDVYDGTISGIMKAMLHIPDGSRDVVRGVLVDMQECLRLKVQYRGEHHSGSGGHNNPIDLDSVEAQIIANDLEARLSVKHATAHVNEHRAKCDPPKIHVEMSAMSSAVLRTAMLHPN